MKTKDWLLLALFAGGAYYLYRTATGVSRALTSAGEAIGSGLFDLFHPDQVGETLFYKAKFPDGKFHSVPSRAVNADGIFLNKNLAPNYPGDGRKYRLLVDRSITVGENKTAVPL